MIIGRDRKMVVAHGWLRRLRDYVLLKRKVLIDAGCARAAADHGWCATRRVKPRGADGEDR